MRVGKIGSKSLLVPLFTPSVSEQISDIDVSSEIFAVVDDKRCPKSKKKRLLELLQDQTKLVKLHRAYGHCSVNKMLKHIKAIGGKESEYRGKIQSVLDSCQICLSFRRVSTRPSPGGWTSDTPNDFVVTDITEFFFPRTEITRYDDCRVFFAFYIR